MERIEIEEKRAELRLAVLREQQRYASDRLLVLRFQLNLKAFIMREL
jgi:hypothetical protein